MLIAPPQDAGADAVKPASPKASAGSATLLLMMSAVLSGVLALVRIKYVNAIFGAGVSQDAYRAAFKLPDLLAYFLVGSAASVSMITMLNRYRERGDDDGADRALSVVMTTMLAVLAGVMVVVAAGAPWILRFFYKPDFFADARGPLCIAMTRMLLPAQLFFFAGSMMSARLQVRKIFVYQACTPVIYNLGIVLGAYFLHRRLGIYSLVVGVFAGVIVGSTLLNTLGALRTGLRFRPRVDLRDPAFREWLTSAAPLMIGVSLVMFDSIFFNRFASGQVGAITLINNAKDLFNAPFNVIGPAAGTASLPFFAALYQRQQMYDFSATVGRSVTRLFSVGMLVSAWMLALAPWLIDLMAGGKFSHANAVVTTHLFMIFAVTLALWAVQGIYARAFYAASDTRTPAIAGTVIVVLSAPLYWAMFRWFGLDGLAFASDIGIVAQTVTLAVLLQRKRLVSVLHLEYVELGRSLAATAAAFAAAAVALHFLPAVATHRGDILVIAAGSVVWAGVAGAVLVLSGSRLPAQVLRRGTA